MADPHAALVSCADKDHHMSLGTRLGYMEVLLGDSADKHSKEIEAAEAKMADLHSALESCANQDRHMSLETRLGYMEALLGDLVCRLQHISMVFSL